MAVGSSNAEPPRRCQEETRVQPLRAGLPYCWRWLLVHRVPGPRRLKSILKTPVRPPWLLACHPEHRHGVGPWASVRVRWGEGALLFCIAPQFPLRCWRRGCGRSDAVWGCAEPHGCGCPAVGMGPRGTSSPHRPRGEYGLGGSSLCSPSFPVHSRELTGGTATPWPSHPGGPEPPPISSVSITSHNISSSLSPPLSCSPSSSPSPQPPPKPPVPPIHPQAGRRRTRSPTSAYASGNVCPQPPLAAHPVPSSRSQRAGAGGPQSPSRVCRVGTDQLLGTTCRHQIAFLQSSAAEKPDFPLRGRC